MATTELYVRCLEAVVRAEGRLKDDTYMLHLLTETERQMKTSADLSDCGVLAFIHNVIMERRHSTESAELVTFALQLARLSLTVTRSDEGNTGKAVLDAERLIELLVTEDNNVTSALLQYTIAALECTRDAKIAFDPKISSWLVDLLVDNSSYHVRTLACHCLATLVSTLLSYSDVDNDEESTYKSIVNPNKVVGHLLQQYFERMTDRRTLLLQLKTILNALTNSEQARSVILDCIAERIDFSFLPYSPADFCFLQLEICLSPGRSSTEAADSVCMKLLRLEEAGHRGVAVQEMIRRMDQHPSLLIGHIQGYIEAEARKPTFIKLISSSPATAKLLASNQILKDCCMEACTELLIKSSTEDVSSLNVKSVISILKFIDIVSSISSLKPATTSTVLKYVKAKIQGFLGVPESLKSECCDLLASLTRNKRLTASDQALNDETTLVDLNELILPLGGCALNAGLSWQLRDSAVHCLAALVVQFGPRLSQSSSDIVNQVVRSCSRDGCSYLRASSYTLLSAITTSSTRIDVQTEVQYLDQVADCLRQDEEALVRRSAVDHLAAWLPNVSSDRIRLSICQLQVRVLQRDLDWEVKVKSAAFWAQMLNQESRTTVLEDHGFFTAVQLGLTDYETSVQLAFKQEVVALIEQKTDWLTAEGATKLRKVNMHEGVDPLSSKKSSALEPEYEDEDVNEMIEGIVAAEDINLLSSLKISNQPINEPNTHENIADFSRLGLEDFLHFYQQHSHRYNSDQEIESSGQLNSILEDIINSVSEIGLVEIVDCY